MISSKTKEIVEKVKDNLRPDKFYEELSQNLLKESDRGCTIICAELLNDDLERLLRVSFRQDKDSQKVVDSLFNSYAPLSTFSSKISMCYSLNLITYNMFSTLENIRKIRNKFAHERGTIDFSSNKVRDIYFNIVDSKPNRLSEETLIGSITKDQLTNRIKFVLCATDVMSRINFMSDLVFEGASPSEVVIALDAQVL